MDITTLNKQVQQESLFLQDLKREVGKVIVGQDALLEKCSWPCLPTDTF